MPNSETLARIQEEFHTLLRERRDDLAVTCFYEELPLTVGGMVSYPYRRHLVHCTYHTIGR